MRPPLLSSEEADSLDSLDKEAHIKLQARGLRRHAAERPCVQALGPFLSGIIIDPARFSKHHPLGKGRNRRT